MHFAHHLHRPLLSLDASDDEPQAHATDGEHDEERAQTIAELRAAAGAFDGNVDGGHIAIVVGGEENREAYASRSPRIIPRPDSPPASRASRRRWPPRVPSQ